MDCAFACFLVLRRLWRFFSKVVTPDDTKSSHGERLGRVSFSQYKCALRYVARSGVVCIRELDDTSKTVE